MISLINMVKEKGKYVAIMHNRFTVREITIEGEEISNFLIQTRHELGDVINSVPIAENINKLELNQQYRLWTKPYRGSSEAGIEELTTMKNRVNEYLGKDAVKIELFDYATLYSN